MRKSAKIAIAVFSALTVTALTIAGITFVVQPNKAGIATNSTVNNANNDNGNDNGNDNSENLNNNSVSVTGSVTTTNIINDNETSDSISNVNNTDSMNSVHVRTQDDVNSVVATTSGTKYLNSDFNVDSAKEKAKEAVVAVCTYSATEIKNNSFASTLARITDQNKMYSYKTDNVLYEESLTEWQTAMSSYNEVRSYVESVPQVSYRGAQQEGGEYVPVLTVHVIMVANAGEPSSTARYWMSMNRYSAYFNVYLTHDASKVYKITRGEEKIQDMDVNHFLSNDTISVNPTPTPSFQGGDM